MIVKNVPQALSIVIVTYYYCYFLMSALRYQIVFFLFEVVFCFITKHFFSSFQAGFGKTWKKYFLSEASVAIMQVHFFDQSVLFLHTHLFPNHPLFLFEVLLKFDLICKFIL